MNHGWTYHGTIGPAGAGRTLIEHLVASYGHTDEAGWRARILAGLVSVDGRAAQAEERLARGQAVAWSRPPWEEPEAPLVYAVLFEDEDLLAVAKPSGLPTNPGGGFLDHTLLRLVQRRRPEASPVHRLGRGTSGIVLFARTPQAAASLSEALRERQAVKVYRALVDGSPREGAFTVRAPIGPMPRGGRDGFHAASERGKPATSHVQVIERRDGASLVEVRIETGRPHQIRIHMAACGHPLMGDPLYAPGGGFTEGNATPGDLGYHLHALRLSLPHPRTGRILDLECRPPAVLRSRSGR